MKELNEKHIHFVQLNVNNNKNVDDDDYKKRIKKEEWKKIKINKITQIIYYLYGCMSICMYAREIL